MVRKNTRFVCQSCGAVHPRWAGRCEACGEWNSIAEEAKPDAAPVGDKRGNTRGGGRRIEFVSLDGKTEATARWKSGIGEFDRVNGGGLVPGSALLIGGDPGIGKSTLLLQVVAGLSNGATGVRCAYISGEESIDQVRMRAARLAIKDRPVILAAATNVRDILATLDSDDGPDIVVIDSIQTLSLIHI